LCMGYRREAGQHEQAEGECSARSNRKRHVGGGAGGWAASPECGRELQEHRRGGTDNQIVPSTARIATRCWSTFRSADAQSIGQFTHESAEARSVPPTRQTDFRPYLMRGRLVSGGGLDTETCADVATESRSASRTGSLSTGWRERARRDATYSDRSVIAGSV
jgi:hypothetical protein